MTQKTGKMKYSREIKVAIVALITLGVAYWGFNFLKGVNLFSPTKAYYGVWQHVDGLVEQAPVYVKGYKVGQVDKILYDFTKENSFVVTFSIDKKIILPKGSQVALIQDGLMGGGALEVMIPTGDKVAYYQANDTLPSLIKPGLIDNLQENLLANVNNAVCHLDSVIQTVQEQIEGDHIKNLLANIEQISNDLTITISHLNALLQNKIPNIVTNLDSTICDIHTISENLSQADFDAIIQELETTITSIKQVANDITTQLNSTDGTLGLLLNDKGIYDSLFHTVNSADSLLIDIKANPKRYINVTVFGSKKDK